MLKAQYKLKDNELANTSYKLTSWARDNAIKSAKNHHAKMLACLMHYSESEKIAKHQVACNKMHSQSRSMHKYMQIV